MRHKHGKKGVHDEGTSTGKRNIIADGRNMWSWHHTEALDGMMAKIRGVGAPTNVLLHKR